VTWRWAIEREELEPTGRADVSVWRSNDGARIAVASERWEDGSNAHRLAVGRGNSADEGESDRTVLGHLDRYREATTICPIMNRECRNLWLDAAIYQVRWYVDLDTVLLRMDLVLRIASSDQDATVGKENGFTVIQTGDDSIAQDRESLETWLTGIVEERVEVGVVCETESGNTLVGSSANEESSVRKCSYDRHHTFGRHAFDDPCWGGGFWLNGDSYREQCRS